MLVTIGRKIVFLLAVLASAFLVAAPSVAAPVATGVCSEAARLTSAGLPQQAIGLLKASGAEAVATCAVAWGTASEQVTAAARQAQQAKASATLGETAEAETQAKAALAADRENALAAQLLEELSAAQKPSQPSWLQQASQQLKTFTEKYVTPLGDLLAPMLLAVASMLLVARVLPLLVPGDRWPVLSEPGRRGLALGAGVAAILAAAWLCTVGTAGSVAGNRTWPTTLALAVTLVSVLAAGVLFGPSMAMIAVGVLGVWALAAATSGLTAPVVLGASATAAGAAVLLLGWWLATRLRVTIAAFDGATGDPASAAHVSALLSDLGATPPRGLEIPSGADTTALSDALASIPGAGSVLTRIGQFLAGLLGVTPWRVEVNTVEGDALAVRMSRNAQSVGSVLIRPTDGRRVAGTDKVPVGDLQRLAAAYVLTTLSQKHGKRGEAGGRTASFPGLAGATDWRSLGLHYIATTDLRGVEHLEAQREALTRAVDLDPGNQLAQLAWQHALWRTSQEPADLWYYQNWLGEFVGPLPSDPGSGSGPDQGLRALRLRAAYTRTAVLMNLAHLEDPGHSLSDIQKKYVEARGILSGLLDRSAHGGDATLVSQLSDALKSLPEVAAPQLPAPPPDRESTLTTPRGLYNLACWYASSGTDDLRAVDLLQRVASVESYRTWMPTDPMLTRLMTTDPYKEAFGADPRDDFFGLPLVAPFAPLLKSTGYGHPEVIAAAARAPRSLLDSVLPQEARTTIPGLAQLHQSLTSDPHLEHAAVEILHELSGQQLTTEAAMRRYPDSQREAVCQKILEALTKRCKPSKLQADHTALTADTALTVDTALTGDTALTADSIRKWWDRAYPSTN